MSSSDRRPPRNFSVVARTHDNRYGTALTAFYELVKAAKSLRDPEYGCPADAYSCILFNSTATVSGDILDL